MSAVRHTYEGAGPHAGRSWGFILRPVASLREGYDGWAEDEDKEGEREEIGCDNKEGRKEKWEGKKGEVDIRSISTSMSHLLLHYGFVEDEDNEGEKKKKKQRKESIKTERERNKKKNNEKKIF